MAPCVSWIETCCCPRQYCETMIQLLFSNVTPLACLSLLASSNCSKTALVGRAWAGSSGQRLFFGWLLLLEVVSVRSGCHETCQAAAALANSQHSTTKLALSAIGTRIQDAVLGPGCKMLLPVLACTF